MLGGAVGNTYDRFKRGYVVDYLSLKTKNRKLSDITFNLSDLALFAGASPDGMEFFIWKKEIKMIQCI